MHQVTGSQRIRERLKACGIGITRQRLIIAEVLFARCQHLSAEQIFQAVRERGEKVSKATVYNTLNRFALEGLVREVIVDPGKVFYDSNTGEHHHVYNVDTGELTDIPGGLGDCAELPQLPPDTVPIGIDVVIRVRSSQQDKRI